MASSKKMSLKKCEFWPKFFSLVSLLLIPVDGGRMFGKSMNRAVYHSLDDIITSCCEGAELRSAPNSVMLFHLGSRVREEGKEVP
jgi:hypothetical protein